ncbi:WXG100 family type VII secretion target [Streptomyces sp. NPDC048650]|uniref:WXG100 family type VII secretion target n=1 Tax=unclassified Streptomyces TaxID=2593676 RepID=UPI00371C4579
MSFTVDPADIAGFAKLIDRAAEDMHAGISYIGNQANEDGFQVTQGAVGAIWEELYGNHTQNVQDVKRFLRKVSEILDASGAELKRSAKYYRDTDREQASKIDSTYPQSKRRTPDADLASGGSGDFRDANDARGKLKLLEADPSFLSPDLIAKAQNWAEGHVEEWQFNGGFKSLGVPLDLLSPSAIATEGLKLFFNFDPIGWVATQIGGDWEGYLKCGELWGNLASFCRSVAANIYHGTSQIAVTWTGNAADAAFVYFEEIADLLNSAAESFDSLKENYEMIAYIVFGISDFAKTALSMVLDWALEAGIAALAGVETSSTIIGPIVAAAVVANRALKAIEKYKHIIDAIDHGLVLAKLGTAECGRESASMESKVKKFPVPGRSYDNAVA